MNLIGLSTTPSTFYTGHCRRWGVITNDESKRRNRFAFMFRFCKSGGVVFFS